ncbi:hypothetical protein BBP40_004312 [Aspergillus hancockii]|nr:hypothetical protein BBP40_004312 [Aspergillus hancockii]
MPNNSWSSSQDTGVTGAAKFVTSTLGNTVGGVSRTVGSVTGAATRGIGGTINGATGSAGKPVGDALGSLGTGVEDGATRVAKGVEDAGQSLDSFPNCIKEVKTTDDLYAKACEVFKIQNLYILSKYYRKVVCVCLYQNFLDAESEGLEQFRRRIHESIVRPLEEELHNSCQEFTSLDSLGGAALVIDLYSTDMISGLQSFPGIPSLSGIGQLSNTNDQY